MSDTKSAPAPFMGRIPPWTLVIEQAKNALKNPSNVDGLGYAVMQLENELETQEDGPGNRGYIIAELRETINLVNAAIVADLVKPTKGSAKGSRP